MLYYLIENKNGFEDPLHAGTITELERKKLQLENELAPKRHEKQLEQVWETVTYYIVPKREWDIEHCPLIPVDFS